MCLSLLLIGGLFSVVGFSRDIWSPSHSVMSSQYLVNFVFSPTVTKWLPVNQRSDIGQGKSTGQIGVLTAEPRCKPQLQCYSDCVLEPRVGTVAT